MFGFNGIFHKFMVSRAKESNDIDWEMPRVWRHESLREMCLTVKIKQNQVKGVSRAEPYREALILQSVEGGGVREKLNTEVGSQSWLNQASLEAVS